MHLPLNKDVTYMDEKQTQSWYFCWFLSLLCSNHAEKFMYMHMTIFCLKASRIKENTGLQMINLCQKCRKDIKMQRIANSGMDFVAKIINALPV